MAILGSDPYKLETAQEYLLGYPASSQEFDAAVEHVMWVKNAHPEMTGRCKEIVRNVLKRRGTESHTIAKLKALS